MGHHGRWTADRYVRFVKYYAGNVVLVRGLRGATTDLTWWFGPVSRLRFHRPARFLPDPPTPAALRLPDDFGCAICPPDALRAANRKTGISMPVLQKPNPPTRLASITRGRQISTETERRLQRAQCQDRCGRTRCTLALLTPSYTTPTQSNLANGPDPEGNTRVILRRRPSLSGYLPTQLPFVWHRRPRQATRPSLHHFQ
jgi:hypothetical protein